MKTFLLVSIFTVASADADLVNKLRDVDDVLRRGLFSTRVDVTDVTISKGHKLYNLTSFVEYHDGTRGEHSLKNVNEKVEYFYHQHLRFKNLFRVADGKCETLTLKGNSEIMFPDTNEQSSDNFFLGPTGFIATIPRSGVEVKRRKPNESVRGIETEVWDISNKTHAIRIYFAVDFWRITTRSENASFPLRIQQFVKDELRRNYEFFQVEVFQPDAVARILPHLLPPFMEEMCQLESHHDFPKLDDAFAMVIRSRIGRVVHRTKEWYDPTQVVFRCDQGLDRENENRSDSVISEINDPLRGLVYRTTMNTCEMVATKPQSTRLEPGQLCLAPVIVKAFQLPQPSYIGRSIVRGMLIDVWQTTATSSFFAAARLYVSSEVVVSANAPRGIKLPLRVDFKVVYPSDDTTKVGGDWQVDIFDFGPQSADQVEKSFNIEDCSGPARVMVMTLRSEELVTAHALEKLKIAAKNAVMTIGPIRPLGISSFEVTREPASSDIIATFKLLIPPTYLDSFKSRLDPMAPYERFTKKYETDIDDCARRCIQGACGTIIHCSEPLADVCYLMESSSENDWGDPIGDAICDVYDKTALGKFVYHSLSQIELNLKQAISSSKLSLGIQLGNSTTNVRAYRLERQPTPFNDDEGNRFFQTESKFYYIKPNHTASLHMTEVRTLGECYRSCISQKHLSCAVFSFCPSNPQCVLSSLNIHMGTNRDPQQDEVLVPASSSCTIYSVSYLRNFHRLDGMMRSSKFAVIDKGFSASHCAFKCRQNKYDGLDVCRGFDYCHEQKSCFFYKEHFSRRTADNSTTLHEHPLCDHYALRFSADYSSILKGTLALPSLSDFFDISVDECAQRCSEMSGNICTSFSHCATQNGEKASSGTSCHTYSVVFDGTAQNRTNPDCTVYIKNENVTEIIRPSSRQLKEPIRISGLGDALFAGLMSCAATLGFLIGAVSWSYRDKLQRLMRRYFIRSSGVSHSALVTQKSELELAFSSEHS